MFLKEKKPYIKIQLSNALSKGNIECDKIMVNYLGIIGKNQNKELPNKGFNKKSYTLSRDIVARTLAHMSADVLQELVNVLKADDIIRWKIVRYFESFN